MQARSLHALSSMLLLLGLGSSDAAAPPFSASLDASVPCPRQLAKVGAGYGTDAPVAADATPALGAVHAAFPAALQAQLGALNAPSSVLIAVQNGKVLFESYQGKTRLTGPAVKPTMDSGYKIASNSKVFTSVMLHQLRDRGLLPQGLDTLVSAVNPLFVEPDCAECSSKRGLTLRSLAMQVRTMLLLLVVVVVVVVLVLW